MADSEKKFISNFESKIKSTISKYKLLSKTEKVVVAASGGKDSTTVLHILKKLGYRISAMTVDVDIGSYTKTNVKNLELFCKKEKIPLYIISIRKEIGCSICYMRSCLKSKGIKLNSCAVCGVVRRYLINKAAKQLKADKLATGHNLDDEAQSVMMNIFRNTLQWAARLGPKTGIASAKGFIPRVKPLYFMPEKEVARYSKIMGFPVNYERCPCSTNVFRDFVRNLLNDYEKTNPQVKQNIIGYFLSTLPKLKQKYKAQQHSYCSRCGEPSKSEVCRTCQMLAEIKPKL